MQLRNRFMSVAAALSAVTGIVLGLPDTASASTATVSCALGHFCGVDNGGNRIDYYRCHVNYAVELWGLGEYNNNNQTGGAWVGFYDANGNLLRASGPGHMYINWDPIYSVTLCV